MPKVRAKTRPKLLRPRMASLEWTQSMIVREFGMDARTVGKRLLDAGYKKGSTLTTAEALKAIYGDEKTERLRKVREEADAVALKNAQTRKELIELAVVDSVWNGICATVKQQILNIPIKVEAQYHKGMGQEDIRKLLEREVDHALNSIADAPVYDKPRGD